MDKIELDHISLYAFADQSHARDRELWRGFLCYALPTLFGKTMDDMEELISRAVVSQLEELTNKKKSSKEDFYLRVVSTQLAKELGIAPEFGMSAFFDGDTPTKTHVVKLVSGPIKSRKSKKKPQNNEDAMIGTWLSHLTKIQNEDYFLRKVAEWHSILFSGEIKQLKQS